MTNVKRCAAQKSGTSLYNLSSKLREHGRHAMLSFLSSLPIPVLHILDIEANRFYDMNHQMYEAALLTRCYTQHEKSVVYSHSNEIPKKFAVDVKERQDRLPTMYWLPKLHKRPYKARFIANSNYRTFKIINLLSHCHQS